MRRSTPGLSPHWPRILNTGPDESLRYQIQAEEPSAGYPEIIPSDGDRPKVPTRKRPGGISGGTSNCRLMVHPAPQKSMPAECPSKKAGAHARLGLLFGTPSRTRIPLPRELGLNLNLHPNG